MAQRSDRQRPVYAPSTPRRTKNSRPLVIRFSSSGIRDASPLLSLEPEARWCAHRRELLQIHADHPSLAVELELENRSSRVREARLRARDERGLGIVSRLHEQCRPITPEARAEPAHRLVLTDVAIQN